MPKKYTSQAFDDLFSKQEQPWIQRAACRKVPKELFFATTKDDPKTVTAKVLCNTCCPVRTECLQYALASPWMVGIFGGTDEGERRKIIAFRRSA